jgi:Ca2+-binding EF-hand superfamily protein
MVASHRYDRRCSIELPAAEVEFFVNEDPSLTRTQQASEQQFKMLDSDQNGYLDEKEVPDNVPGALAPFAAVDQNGDGMIYRDELSQFLDLRQAAFRGQIRARAADQADTVFMALDADGDGLLKTREIFQAPDRLRQLDRNGDQRLHSNEIPGSMVVGFIRGNPQLDDGLFVVPAMAPPGQQHANQVPNWFRGMDANGDGEISSREFLGKLTLFAEFDRDRDGFLSVAECQSFEPKAEL